MEKINLFKYTDYRAYLKDKYLEQKATSKHFSFRYFAKVTGFGSIGYLRMVMDGERNLSPTAISKFTRAFKHNKKEAAYFEALVLFNQAKSDADRDEYLERLQALKPQVKLTELEKESYEYFTKYHYAALLEMVSLEQFQSDPEWIATRFFPPIRIEEAEAALKTLEKLGLIKNEDGRWKRKRATLVTPDEVAGLEIYNYHNQMMSLAKNALVRTPSSLRDMSAMTFPLPLSALPKIKKKLMELKREILDCVVKEKQPMDEVYQINLQLFPLSCVKRKSEKE